MNKQHREKQTQMEKETCDFGENSSGLEIAARKRRRRKRNGTRFSLLDTFDVLTFLKRIRSMKRNLMKRGEKMCHDLCRDKRQHFGGVIYSLNNPLFSFCSSITLGSYSSFVDVSFLFHSFTSLVSGL